MKKLNNILILFLSIIVLVLINNLILLNQEKEELLKNSDNLKRIEVIELRLSLLENLGMSEKISHETKELGKLKNSKPYVSYSNLVQLMKLKILIVAIFVSIISIILLKNYLNKFSIKP
ncbi:MAG TPA: hypothetical protein VJ895_01920 [Candidatus Nanoarchaeia archaeon]|nr:hypothetical protein [Candidatus Nanoarchaeia archaeon]